LTLCLKPGFIRGNELKNWRAILGLRSGWLLKKEETWDGDIFGINFWKERCFCHLGWERMERIWSKERSSGGSGSTGREVVEEE